MLVLALDVLAVDVLALDVLAEDVLADDVHVLESSISTHCSSELCDTWSTIVAFGRDGNISWSRLTSS